MKIQGYPLIATTALILLCPTLIASEAVNDKGAKATNQRPTKNKNAMMWARGVAVDFLEAITTDQYQAAWGLLSPEFAQGIKAKESYEKGQYRFDAAFYCEPKILSEEVSPNGNEVLFAGRLKTTVPSRPDGVFRLRVSRGSGTSNWSVRYLSIQETKKP
jgi:hypothetical protein